MPEGEVARGTAACDWGYDPLPSHVEPPESPVSTPERHKEFPLVLITGAKQPMYMHSQSRQIESIRRLAPEPLLEIHTNLARSLNIGEGDFAWIETTRGRLRMRAHLHERIHEGVVAFPHGWWRPEEPGPLHGIFETSSNILTDDDPDLCDLSFGSRLLLDLSRLGSSCLSIEPSPPRNTEQGQSLFVSSCASKSPCGTDLL
jgi:thiosulfate reductase / polysulfide reductase chain A